MQTLTIDWSKPSPIVVGKVLEKSGNFGFDARNEEYADLVNKGIIDPTKVVRIALQLRWLRC